MNNREPLIREMNNREMDAWSFAEVAKCLPDMKMVELENKPKMFCRIRKEGWNNLVHKTSLLI
jgi:hypothetical protein